MTGPGDRLGHRAPPEAGETKGRKPMAVRNWKEIRRRMSPEKEKEISDWIKAERTVLELQELRTLAGKTQSEVAVELEVAQSQLSRLEQRDDHRLTATSLCEIGRAHV